MDWVAIDIHIAGDAVTHRLADQFRIRVAEAAGLLTLAFAGMAQHARDGELAETTDSQIEEWARWHGKRGAFAMFFRAQLCDEAGTVRAWEKYNGRAIRRAEAAKERTRVWREQHERARTERTTSANGTHNRTHNVRRTGQDRTGHNITANSGGADAPPAAPAWLPAIRARWQTRVGRITPAVLVRELSAVAELHGEASLLTAIDAYVEARLELGKPAKLAWFAEEAAVWVQRAGESEAEPIIDGWFSPAGEKATRPTGAAR